MGMKVGGTLALELVAGPFQFSDAYIRDHGFDMSHRPGYKLSGA
jgi:hypothetical protein